MSEMRIFVDAALTGERLAMLHLAPGSTVNQLRSAAQSATSLQWPTLIFDGVELSDGMADMVACGLRDSSVVHLVVGTAFNATLKGHATFDECETARCDEISYAAMVKPGDPEDLKAARLRCTQSSATEITEFSVPNVVAIIKEKHTSEGRVCGDRDTATAERVLSMIESAETTHGFSYRFSHSTHRLDTWGEVHEFLVADCRLSLTWEAKVS